MRGNTSVCPEVPFSHIAYPASSLTQIRALRLLELTNWPNRVSNRAEAYSYAVALPLVADAMRSCIWRVRCGTMPSIRSTTISCAR